MGHRKPAVSQAASQNGGDDEKTRKSIQSVETGVRVLHALMNSPFSAMRLKDIAESAEMSSSQAHRYLLAYINTGLVEQGPSTSLYSLGPTALKIGLAALGRMDVIRHAADCLDALALETGYMGLLTVWSEHGPMVIRLAEGIVPIVVSINLGSVLPLQGSAAGMIYLAFGHPNKFRDILNRERERGEGPNPARFAAMMDQIRSQGYAVADGQVVPGLASVSAPVFNLQGWPIATINLVSRSGDGAFFTQKNFDNIIAATTGASVANGWQPNEGPAIHRYLQ